MKSRTFSEDVKAYLKLIQELADGNNPKFLNHKIGAVVIVLVLEDNHTAVAAVNSDINDLKAAADTLIELTVKKAYEFFGPPPSSKELN